MVARLYKGVAPRLYKCVVARLYKGVAPRLLVHPVLFGRTRQLQERRRYENLIPARSKSTGGVKPTCSQSAGGVKT